MTDFLTFYKKVYLLYGKCFKYESIKKEYDEYKLECARTRDFFFGWSSLESMGYITVDKHSNYINRKTYNYLSETDYYDVITFTDKFIKEVME